MVSPWSRCSFYLYLWYQPLLRPSSVLPNGQDATQRLALLLHCFETGPRLFDSPSYPWWSRMRLRGTKRGPRLRHPGLLIPKYRAPGRMVSLTLPSYGCLDLAASTDPVMFLWLVDYGTL
ncbi:hypothetical protein HBI56_011870 [Parastagonospora nodorum]|uniref:Uncharacterized protein n=1 Tax=Phaeosphaeria nodorum (strain SN15 / ATCC MYA-4574 / FGSC 10173) TaxID=321614 RepID=A0A7U2HWH9_PHANO|nr:hypothetical protein HBH56_009720 [Parastagonospora nodorum]QRC90687.1 hypothetical protein JI435_002100 [Parastagonospora nodorum SN15]KAH3935157.1 hypothetical protein HBH54_043020 [Parastagonospora nodorum]KAH3943609.1 hypothetical protein HBH53_170940 [Parastagonospora nodorum]KAH3986808.1 hypothetical protein HBH51_013580 [Parastagonospora nodorum]